MKFRKNKWEMAAHLQQRQQMKAKPSFLPFYSLRTYISERIMGNLTMMTFPKWRKLAVLMMLDGKVMKTL